MNPVAALSHLRTCRKLRRHLRKQFPSAFPPRGTAPIPLAIGIHEPITLVVTGAFDRADVRRFLRRYTGRQAYLRALLAGGYRVNLDGSAATDITLEDRAHAADRLLAQLAPPERMAA